MTFVWEGGIQDHGRDRAVEFVRGLGQLPRSSLGLPQRCSRGRLGALTKPGAPASPRLGLLVVGALGWLAAR
jgi:hypothetical protein